VREVAKVISAMTFLIGFIIAGLTTRNQALHDFIATTVVVRIRPGHLALALALGVAALMSPFVAGFMLGGAWLTGLTTELTALADKAVQAQGVQTPKPPAPVAAKPALKPVPAAVPAAPAQPVAAQPVAIPPAAPVVLAQANPEPPKNAAVETAREEKAKPVTAKSPATPTPREEIVAPREEATARLAPIPSVAAEPAGSGPKFNDLTTAVLYRDAKAVEELLEFGKWPDKPDSRGLTPLQLAAMQGDAPIAEALLKAGADPNRAGPAGETAVSIARDRKDDRMLGLLREYGGR
jgi:hypothetical protein